MKGQSPGNVLYNRPFLTLLPAVGISLLMFPLILFLIYRDVSFSIVVWGVTDSVFIVSGIALTFFAGRQLAGKTRAMNLYFLAASLACGLTIAFLAFFLYLRPVFFVFGMNIIVIYFLINFVFMLMMNILILGTVQYSHALEENRRKAELELSLRRSLEERLHAARVNPHFLFNSLNMMISHLDNRDKAEELLLRLSRFLRYSLDALKQDRITLKEELGNVEEYLILQKERFGTRLNYSLPQDVPAAFLPPLILQPLLENSVKHNMDRAKKLTVTVDCRLEDHRLILIVSDSEAALTPDMIGKGQGLDITSRRLALIGGALAIVAGGLRLEVPQ